MAYKIGDFSFDTLEEAKAAEKEAKAISYIMQQMKMEEPEAVLKLYCQMIEKDLFHTELGLAFLEEIHERLLEQGSVDKHRIPPLPGKGKKPKKMKKARDKRPKNKKNQKPVDMEKELLKYKKLTKVLLVVCITLVLIVVGMFVVNATSQHPTILNYEQEIVNKYASWEEELTKREEALKIQEKNL